MRRLGGYIDRGLDAVRGPQEVIRQQVRDIAAVSDTLDPARGDRDQRRAGFAALLEQFRASIDPVRQQMAGVMAGFETGLFVGGDAPEFPQDNLELERWFRLPKGHERRIHGHRHAGVRIVQEGPTLMLVLDAHRAHPGQFTVSELLPYRRAQPPACQRAAVHRRKVMRKARSKKKRSVLLADLERRYLSSS